MKQSYLARTELLLGQEAMERISAARVILFGVGGVGSWCAEGLVRSGIRHLTIVDSDRISESNVNRQLMATSSTVGKIKVEVLRNRLTDINPEAEIIALREIYSAETASRFDLDSYDYVIDAIDSLKDKCDLIVRAAASRATFFSSMGSALKIDPLRIRVAPFAEVRGCPLGSALRKKLRREGRFPDRPFLCVYDDEVLPNLGAAPTGEVVYPPTGKSLYEEDMADRGPEHPSKGVDARGLVNGRGPRSGRDLPFEGYTSGPATEDMTSGSTSKAVINGTMAHITAIFGFTLAGLVFQDITRR